ncbi:hypothetical protein Tco_0522050 [Tanacetum coccineum]
MSVIPEEDVIKQSETVTTTSAPTISSLLSSLYPALQQIASIPTPTTNKATTSTIVVPDSKTLTALHQRITDLEKDVKELKDVDNFTKVIQKNVADIIKEYFVPAETVERLRQQYAPQKSVEDIRESKMEHARKQQVPKETITSSDTATLVEFDQKTTLFETMTKSKSFNKSPKQRALYHALMESILEDVNQNRGNNFNQGQIYRPPVHQPVAHQGPAPQTHGVSKTDFERYVTANDAVFEKQAKPRLGASTSGSGTLPGNTVTNPKEDLKGITTRSGVTIQGPKAINHDIETPYPTPEPNVAPVVTSSFLNESIPFPSRRKMMKGAKEKSNDPNREILEIFRDLSCRLLYRCLEAHAKICFNIKTLIGTKKN